MKVPAKKINRRKGHILLDTTGVLLLVTAANVQN
jgi:hypothetical protein